MPWVNRLLGSLLLLSLGAGCVKRPVDYQRELARTLRPAELTGFAAEDGAPRPAARLLRVRAWADEDFQAQTPHWRDRIGVQVRRANRVLEPQFGCRLELVDVGSWPRASRPAELEASLAQLRADDPGRDVDLVIGFVSAVRLPTALTELLGAAELGGRHLVLRAMVWAQEYDELERALGLLSAEERVELDRQRRVHREVTVLLHEWAHLHGAAHEGGPPSIMDGQYHPQAIGFTPAAVRVIRASLLAAEAVRHAGAPAPRDTASGAATSTPSAPPPGPGAPTPAGSLPPRLRPGAPPPGPPPPARIASAGPAAALAALAVREAALLAREGPPEAWLQLAREADRLGAPALTERAAQRAGAAPAAAFLVADARRRRREVALPLDGTVAPEREPAYVEAVGRVLDGSAGREKAKARDALRRLEAAFPGSSGLALAACAMAAAERGPSALEACTAAVQAFAEAPRAQLLLGTIHGRAGRWAEARDRFRQALALDGSTGEPWERLAAALVRLGGTAELRELEAAHQARFGMPLRAWREER
jgi:hypothetical protein